MPTLQNELTKTAFLNACASGDLEYVKKCIREISPAGINRARDSYYCGAIYYALRSHSIECIRLLLAVDSIDVKGSLMSALLNNCSIDIIRLLIEFDPSMIITPHIIIGNQPIHYAINRRRSLEVVQLMVETLKRNDMPLVDDAIEYDRNIIALAALSREFEILEYLIENTPFDVEKHRGPLKKNVLLDLLNGAHLSSDPRCEYTFVVLHKLFLKLYGGTDMSLMVNDAIIPMILTIKTQSFRHTDWFIENVYLSATNEHREMAARTFDLIKKMAAELDVESQKNVYRLIIPLHSLMKIDPGITSNEYLRIPDVAFWRELHRDSIAILRNDRNLFRQWYAIFNERFKRPSDEEFFRFIVELVFDTTIAHSTLIEFLEIANRYKSIGGNDCVFAFIERAKTDTRNKIEDILPRFLTVYMPFTAKTSADTIITVWTEQSEVVHRNLRDHIAVIPHEAYEGLIRFSLNDLTNSTLNREDVMRYCGQQFHRDPLPLAMLCRNFIRKSVFRPVRSGDCSITVGLERLMSLPVPVHLKNFLRFNYTAYDLSTAQSEN